MKTYIEQVQEFHILGNQPILEIPQIPSEDRCKLRYDLIREELEELKVALAEGDLVEVIDALCDLQFVLSGTVLETGFKNIFDICFGEVSRSNMTKSVATYEEALVEADLFAIKNIVTKIEFRENISRYVILNAVTNKLLKPSTYSPANLRPIVEEFLNKLN